MRCRAVQVAEGEGGNGSQWQQLRFDEYFGGAPAGGGAGGGRAHCAEGAHSPAMLHCVGHEVLSKTFNGMRLSMCDDFPLTMQSMLPVFETLALTNEQARPVRLLSTALLHHPHRACPPLLGSVTRGPMLAVRVARALLRRQAAKRPVTRPEPCCVASLHRAQA